jgi:hypothetical protein
MDINNTIRCINSFLVFCWKDDGYNYVFRNLRDAFKFENFSKSIINPILRKSFVEAVEFFIKYRFKDLKERFNDPITAFSFNRHIAGHFIRMILIESQYISEQSRNEVFRYRNISLLLSYQ